MDHSGDKFADLHKLASKIDYVKPRVDRSPHDVDYDKNKSECYFKPKLRQSTQTLAESAASGAGGSQSNFGIVSGKKKSSKVTHSMSTINFSQNKCKTARKVQIDLIPTSKLSQKSHCASPQTEVRLRSPQAMRESLSKVKAKIDTNIKRKRKSKIPINFQLMNHNSRTAKKSKENLLSNAKSTTTMNCGTGQKQFSQVINRYMPVKDSFEHTPN